MCGEEDDELEEEDEEWEEERIGEPKPMLPLAMRLRMTFWSPTKAPAQMKRILSVRTLYVSALEGPVEVLLPEPEEEELGCMFPPDRGLLVG